MTLHWCTACPFERFNCTVPLDPDPTARCHAMPANSAARSASPNSCVAQRAISLRNAGISARSPRPNRDTVLRGQADPVNDPAEDSVHDSSVERATCEHEIAHSSQQHGAQICDPSTPEGCAMGIPLPIGQPVSRVPDQPLTLDLAIMRSIQSDNYKFIRHMIMAGWSPTNNTACGFSVNINRNSEREVWHVRQATPLHYAVCCGALQAASALLIAFPELAFLSCKVETSCDDFSRATSWTALDFASFFGNLYVAVEEERHLAYKQASLVLLHLKEDRSRLPFMEAETARERLADAGKDPRKMTAAMLEAIS